MTIASSLPPSLKSGLRPYWHALKRLQSDFDRTADEFGLRTRIWTSKVRQAFVPVRAPAAANGRLNLHLGCGGVDHPEFVNVDGYPFPHVDFVQTIDRLPRFKTGTVDLIYASHCLEHFHYRATVDVLTEWNRVLKRGGILRLSVPDFDKLVDLYQARGRDPDVVIEQLMGGQNNRYNFHYTALSEVNLTRALLAAGFSSVRPWQPGTNPLTTFADFSVYQKEVDGRGHEISLNIEAVK
jgi:predicted SAM-dependent methyltransferase